MRSLLQIGKSLFDEAGSKQVKGLVKKAKTNNVKLVFPVDYITADKFDKDAKVGFVMRSANGRPARRPTKLVSPPTGKVSTADPNRTRSSQRPFWKPRPSCGTVRQGSSSSQPSQRDRIRCLKLASKLRRTGRP